MKRPIKKRLKIQISKLIRPAFTLIELIIVVAILGILAAIVLPEVQGHTQRAKEAAAKDNLRILRNAIERYASEHNDVPPGYKDDIPSADPHLVYFLAQIYRDYLSDLPENPFTQKSTFTIINNSQSFPTQASDTYGWIYKPSTREIRLDTTGTDNEGNTYFSY